MRPLIGLGGHQRRSPVKIKVLFSGAKITTSSSGRGLLEASSTCCVPLMCLWCACACLHQLLFSRRLGQDVWLQALSRLIRRPRPSAVQVARRPPPRRRIYREKRSVYYIWSGSAFFPIALAWCFFCRLCSSCCVCSAGLTMRRSTNRQ
ncbi:hypothetical protein LI328DRAFT_110278 [Trichoderma asperelloides]|nr:hypothetical protein LI328DRAFT_110278 [Trichoderma asperelloides]